MKTFKQLGLHGLWQKTVITQHHLLLMKLQNVLNIDTFNLRLSGNLPFYCSIPIESNMQYISPLLPSYDKNAYIAVFLYFHSLAFIYPFKSFH